MNKTLKKSLYLGLSVLTLAGAGATLTTNPIHASRISSLRARRNRDYKDIKRINAQIFKLEHKRTNPYSNKKRNTRHYKYGSGEWFAHNANHLYKKLYNKYYVNPHYMDDRINTTSYPFTEGFSDGDNDEGMSYGPTVAKGLAVLDQTTKNLGINHDYIDGWIISFANHGRRPGNRRGVTSSTYNQAKKIFRNGQRAEHNDPDDGVFYYNRKTHKWLHM